MFAKIISQLNLAKHLKIMYEKLPGGDKRAIITARTNAGVTAGKALAYEFSNPSQLLKECNEAVVVVTGSTALQFLGLYLAAPAGVAPNSWFGAAAPNKQKSLKFNLVGLEAARQLLDMYANSSPNGGLLQTSGIPIFEADVSFVLKLTEKEHIEFQKFMNDDNFLRFLLSSEDQSVNDSAHQEINAKFQDFFNRFVTIEIVSDRSAEPLSLDQTQAVTTALIPDSGKTFHVPSDETAHMFFTAGQTLVIVDAGNETLPDIIDSLSPDDVAAIKQAKIYLTHGHNDHTAHTLNTLNSLIQAGITTALILPGGDQYIQSWGFLSTNKPDLKTLKDSGKLFITTQVNPSVDAAESSDTQIAEVKPPEAIKHFIPSKGFSFWSNGTKQIRIFTGDINPQPNQDRTEIEQALKEYIIALLQSHNSVTESPRIDIFMDFGHFLAHPDHARIREFMESLPDQLKAELDLQVSPTIYLDHLKQTTGFQLAVDHDRI